MSIDPEILKQLIKTFDVELKERLQVITNGLLALEKGSVNEEERENTIAAIFRAAHNIKGASGSLNIKDVTDIAHHIESLFAAIQNKVVDINSEVIDLCFEAVDKIELAMQAFIENKAVDFNVTDLTSRLEKHHQEHTKSSKSPIKPQKSKPFEKQKAQSPPLTDESVRVSVTSIDKISALMEEIQANKIAMDDHYDELVKLTNQVKHFSLLWKQILYLFKNYIDKTPGDNLQKLYFTGADNYTEISSAIMHMQKNMQIKTNELTLLFNSLQDETRTLRLIPAATFLDTLPRYVRDLCHDLNKQVEFTITGDEVKLDKMVLENLKDPIIHLLRNSIDHGIEPAAEREAKGKSKNGHVVLDISEEGGQIVVHISDDGKGIDINDIKNSAKKNNLQTDTLSQREILDLIFTPGFSTKEIITNISGRGVGLDVVKSNIENLNGQVSFTSTPDKGTVFELRAPLSLASKRGFIVSSGAQLFVIPTSAVQRVSIVSSDEIFDLEGRQALMLDDHPQQLYSLIDLLMLEQKEFPKHNQFTVFIRNESHTIAILVDEILGEREIVMKPLQAPLSNVDCIAGGTLFGNNQVIIVLDPKELLNRALNIGHARRISLQEVITPESISTVPHILVVDDSITTRALEKNILESKNYKVTTAVNGKEAWDLLQKQAFSLVITDVVMPIMDGFTLTENVKKSDKLQKLPVIIVTSLGSETEKKRGIEAGADAYIIKNEFESGILLEIVEQLV